GDVGPSKAMVRRLRVRRLLLGDCCSRPEFAGPRQSDRVLARYTSKPEAALSARVTERSIAKAPDAIMAFGARTSCSTPSGATELRLGSRHANPRSLQTGGSQPVGRPLRSSSEFLSAGETRTLFHDRSASGAWWRD